MLAIFHTTHGHRSPEHTALMYELVTGYKLSPDAVRAQKPCESCDVAKIKSASNQKIRIMPITEVGSDVAADTIVSMPRSLSGYKHIAHIHDIKSDFGAVFCIKTKSCSDLILYWIKWLQNRTKKTILRLHLDGGEMKSKKLVVFLDDQGTELIENLADVHSNTTIERRHDTLISMSSAQMHRGGANELLWEFCIPNTNNVMNLTIPIRKLRKCKLRHKGPRAPTPFELVECDGTLINMMKLWADVHPMFSKCIGKKESVTMKQHEAPGMEGVYLGPVHENGNVKQYGHFMLRHSDGKIIKVRKVKCFADNFPMRPDPEASLTYSSSGGQSVKVTDELKSSTKAKIPQKGTTRILSFEKFPSGSSAMSVAGPCIILGRYDDGDYQVKFPEGCEPQEVRSVKYRDIWLPSEWPDWQYNGAGERMGITLEQKTTKRMPKIKVATSSKQSKLLDFNVEKLYEHSDENKEEKQPARYNTRSRTAAVINSTRAALRNNTQFRVYDRGKDELQTLSYPFRDIVLPATNKCNSAKRVIPDSPTITMKEITQMLACDVESALPRHWHQTKGHPYEPFLMEGEIHELQDCCNRGVFGAPIQIEAGMIIIGLMWVYAIKKFDITGLFRKFRARLVLLGNQERNHLARLEAYAPVAQAITARLMIAAFFHIVGVFFKKLDVSNAYINEFMKRMVHCKMPPGYLIEVVNGQVIFRRLRPGERQPPNMCLPLIMALYGGMDCGRIFWEAWVDWHINDGFQIIHEERCYLHKCDSNDNFIRLCYHVDDNLIAARGQDYYEAYLKRLATKFDYTEGDLDSHLGVAYHFDRSLGFCKIEQSAQTWKFLSQFGYQDCKPAQCPALSGPVPCKADCEEEISNDEDKDFDMEGFVGHANYLHMCTRPDIGQVLKILSTFTKKFGPRHIHYARHLLRYLKGTINEGLTYRTGFPLYYQIFTDASHASCVDTRRSIISIVVKFGGNTVYWRTSYTKIVSHSSTESELMALDVGATIGECCRWLAESMGAPIQGCIQIFVDNAGTISISSNPIQSGRNLHVHARYFYVRDLVYDDQVMIEKIPTEMQVADVGCTFKGNHTFLTLKKYLMHSARILHDDNNNPFWEINE
jgi:hypothetical protein